VGEGVGEWVGECVSEWVREGLGRWVSECCYVMAVLLIAKYSHICVGPHGTVTRHDESG
jgi:hypothetical protein